MFYLLTASLRKVYYSEERGGGGGVQQTNMFIFIFNYLFPRDFFHEF